MSNEGILFIDGEEIGKVIDIDFGLLNSVTTETIIVAEKLEFSLHNLKINIKGSKRLFKLPRKKKKKIMGTKSARNKLSKRIKFGLPFNLKHIKRAGLKVAWR